MEVTQSNATTEVAENFVEDIDFQEYISNPGADWIDADDICLKLTEDMNNKLWGETPPEPQHLVATMLGFKININVILLGDDRLIKKLGNVVIGVIAEWQQVHRIFKFFELEVEDKTAAKDYAVLGLQYIKRLKLARDDDISVLVGDHRLNFFRLNKGGILNVGGAIAIGAHQNLANAEIRDFSADKTY
ncbi:hypothetical protein MKX03_005242 [Papaver bracteatum]|nr:hypothetical protein MKX03_005242 [Papaver bracteatum]